MVRIGLLLTLLCVTPLALCQGTEKKKTASFDYDATRLHELKPHRRNVPLKGVRQGFNQLYLRLTVSPTGDVVDAKADGQEDSLRHWPELEAEVYQWKFSPFEQNGVPVQAEVEEYIDLVPPERIPKVHVPAPPLRLDSKISISLERTGCFGTCPGYQVTIANSGIRFHGGYYVVAAGDHVAPIEREKVTRLAEHFLAADFYSMEPEYTASVTDLPTYSLQLEIDGRKNKVVDYSGSWVGMPAIISELEQEVDEAAETNRWVSGSKGLIPVLKAESYNFKTFGAQVILKEVASRGESTTVAQLLASGVPLKPLPAPKPTETDDTAPFGHVGWLNAANRYPEVLQVLIGAGASKTDQEDKDLALSNAASSGSLPAVKLLLSYGANPNADLTKLTMHQEYVGMAMEGPGVGSVLISAAASGNPDLITEILKHNPKLEAKDGQGKTALFSAGEGRSKDKEGARGECVRLLAKAGANVSARDKHGNTPLHETYVTEVEEELLKLGADVNARNNEGNTPIATTVDSSAYLLFLDHGADLTIRNNAGKTMMEVVQNKGPAARDALHDALETLKLEHRKSR